MKTKSKKHYAIIIISILAGALLFINLNYLIDKPVEKEIVKESFGIKKEGILTFHKTDGEKIQIDIEIADDDNKRQAGLMFRDKLEMTEGMLFIFDEEEYRSFWMKDTKLPLDLIFVDSNLEIVDIAYGAVPFSEKSIISNKPALYVVEVKAGFVSLHSIKVQDKISYKKN